MLLMQEAAEEAKEVESVLSWDSRTATLEAQVFCGVKLSLLSTSQEDSLTEEPPIMGKGL